MDSRTGCNPCRTPGTRGYCKEGDGGAERAVMQAVDIFRFWKYFERFEGQIMMSFM